MASFGRKLSSQFSDLLPKPLEAAADAVSGPGLSNAAEFARRTKERAGRVNCQKLSGQLLHRRSQIHDPCLSSNVGLVLVEDPHREILRAVRRRHLRHFTGAATR